MKSELEMPLFAGVLVCMHALSKNRHEPIQLIVVTLAPHYHMKYLLNQLENLHTNGGEYILLPNKRGTKLMNQNLGKIQLSQSSLSQFCSKSVFQNHVLNSIIDGFVCIVEINTLLTTLVVYYFQLMHTKPLIILYICSVIGLDKTNISEVFSYTGFFVKMLPGLFMNTGGLCTHTVCPVHFWT